eukprot:g1586.t1
MTLADELREFAFAAPPKEDYLDVDLDDTQDLFLKEDRHELATHITETKPHFRTPVELEGSEYEGVSISRNQTFSESSEFEEQDAISSVSALSVESDRSDLYEKYNQLTNDIGLTELRKGALRDRKRGLAVQRDQKQWKECLELRVSLQKALTNSHRLPPPTSHLTLSSNSRPVLASKDQELTKTCRSLIEQLLDLEAIRLSRKHCKEADYLVKSLHGVIWDEIEKQYLVLSEFRDASLDRYHRQAMLQSGASTKKGNLKILHQGISKQVQTMLQFPNKALVKAKMPISEQPKVIGAAYEDNEQQEGLNGEIYNDLEFYQGLLNEYLVNQGMNATPVMKPRKRMKTGQSNKRKKALFTNVQEKLVNFMTPVQMDEPDFAKQLFQNLFGM